MMQLGTMSNRATELGNRMRARRDASKLEDLDRDNDRLRNELRTLRAEVDRDRKEREDMLDALTSTRVTKVVKRRRGLVRTLIVAGVAYVLGAKAGRGRYDEIMAQLRSLRDRGKERLERSADDTADDLIVMEDRPTAPGTPREMEHSPPGPATAPSAPITPRDRAHRGPA